MAKSKGTQFSINGDETARLSKYLNRLGANDQMIEFLRKIQVAEDLTSLQLRTAKNLTYSEIVEQISRAIKDGYVEPKAVAEEIHRIETSGSPHVLLYKVRNQKKSNFNKMLLAPSSSHNSALSTPELRDFCQVPSASTVRILSNSNDLVKIQIVFTQSGYEKSKSTRSDGTRVTEEVPVKERSSLTIKVDFKQNLVQCRLPQVLSSGTNYCAALYRLFKKQLNDVYSTGTENGVSRFNSNVELIDPTKAFRSMRDPNANDKDFALLDGHQQEDTIDHRSWSRQDEDTPMASLDIRNSPNYPHIPNSSCRQIEGVWELPSSDRVKTRIHYDNISLGPKKNVNLTRILLLSNCTDSEIDHVIRRFLDYA